MPTRGLKDLFLPRKLAYHVKIILGSFLFALVFTILSGDEFIFTGQLIFKTVVVFIQLEIFLWMAMHVFFKDPIKIDKKYTKIIIRKLIIFYLLILLISAAVLVLTSFVMTLING